MKEKKTFDSCKAREHENSIQVNHVSINGLSLKREIIVRSMFDKLLRFGKYSNFILKCVASNNETNTVRTESIDILK